MIRWTQTGESNIVLSISYDKTSQCVAFIRRAWLRLLSKHDPAIVSVRPALDSLAVEYRGELDAESLCRDLESLESVPETPADLETSEPLTIPVCYDPSVGFDLTDVAERAGMTVEEVAELHASARYDVWMIGFMPGFPYMGATPQKLRLPRKERPTPRIPAGSVAIAEEYTGVYPFDSPGGWHVIGRTPARVTAYSAARPWLFEYGMKVRFTPITIEDYGRICRDVRS